MKPAPKIPWPYRIAALTAALLIGLCYLQIYVFGAKFAGAVAALSRMNATPPVAAQEAPSEPGVVPVRIISEKK